jgi:glycosyltransferase involved in cell wall biosynthesis
VISVIIPTYNRADLVVRAIQSADEALAVSQIIVVDDASTDATAQTIAALADSLSATLHFEQLDTNQGAPAARNRGIELATEDTLLFLDSDDTLLLEGVSVLAKTMQEDQSLDFVYGKVRHQDDEAGTLISIVGEPFNDDAEAVAGYHWHTLGALYRRQFIEASVGAWNTSLAGAQDWEFQARVKITASRFQFIDCEVGIWRSHAGEHIGTVHFRLKYTESVVMAASSILKATREADFTSGRLERKIAWIMLWHYLEMVFHEDESTAAGTLLHIKSSFQGSVSLKLAVQLIAMLPKSIKTSAWMHLNQRRLPG